MQREPVGVKQLSRAPDTPNVESPTLLRTVVKMSRHDARLPCDSAQTIFAIAGAAYSLALAVTSITLDIKSNLAHESPLPCKIGLT